MPFLLQWINTITYNNGIKKLIYLMRRIKGDVSCQRHGISILNIAYLVMTDCKKQERMSLFKQVLREIAMVRLETP